MYCMTSAKPPEAEADIVGGDDAGVQKSVGGSRAGVLIEVRRELLHGVCGVIGGAELAEVLSPGGLHAIGHCGVEGSGAAFLVPDPIRLACVPAKAVVPGQFKDGGEEAVAPLHQQPGVPRQLVLGPLHSFGVPVCEEVDSCGSGRRRVEALQV
eukprot:CAMPEP_0174344562 /NCGR_PEP_ID=MMETSP0810-20121108/27737_1 /TAXON_ID=73025 ORGANISM="Eutreptiella gymnastica-like, Strain CCMP1594" /NCGR_SAMPLE_ID=MMETSP0810 /ASSEMBLY_ACC=CAM_ASM_000659 /LENGTH=153 /DNA_ID=CAMNT_0015467725 /DNA_START=184 /DNA_END=644 /DNA_ORIENTATION=+